MVEIFGVKLGILMVVTPDIVSNYIKATLIHVVVELFS